MYIQTLMTVIHIHLHITSFIHLIIHSLIYLFIYLSPHLFKYIDEKFANSNHNFFLLLYKDINKDVVFLKMHKSRYILFFLVKFRSLYFKSVFSIWECNFEIESELSHDIYQGLYIVLFRVILISWELGHLIRK